MTLLLVFFFAQLWDHARSAKQALASLFLVGNFGAYRFSGGDYFDPNPNPLVHLWSLSAEEQIYLLVPLLMLVVLYLFKRIKMYRIFLTLTILFLLAQYTLFPDVFQLLGFQNVSGIIFYSPFSYIWKFAIGGLSYLAFERKSIINDQSKYRLILYSIIMLFILLSPKSITFLEVVIVPIGGLLLYGNYSIPAGNTIRQLLKYIGDRSYSVYLVHWPVIYVFSASPFFHYFSEVWRILLSLVSIFVLSEALYKYVEIRNLERFRTTDFPSKLIKKSILCFCIIPIIFSVIFMNISNTMNPLLSKEKFPDYAGSADPQCNRLQTGKACWYNHKDSQKIALLIGDSIAMGYSQAFIEQMKIQKLTAVTLGLLGCSFILPSDHLKSTSPELYSILGTKAGDNEVSCFDHNRNILEFISQFKPELIYLSQHSIDSENLEYLKINRESLELLRAQNISALNSRAKKLIVLGATPLFSSKVLIATPTIWKIHGRTTPVPLTDLEESYLADDQKMNELLSKSGIIYVSLVKYFCSKGECPLIQSQKRIYRDGSHISVFGSSLLKQVFRTYY